MMPGWLRALHKAQAVMDSAIRLALRQESAVRGQSVACHKGCPACCEHGAATATAVEIGGALNHLMREDSGRARAVLSRFGAGEAQGCPLLVEGECAAYAMRMLSCRQVVVFNAPCASGENPLRSRRGDVLTPLPGQAARAYGALLPHMGVEGLCVSGADLAGLLLPVRKWAAFDPRAILSSLQPGASALDLVAA